MKEIGFPITKKENELRRAILPEELAALDHPECCFIEKGFGVPFGIPDERFTELGARIAGRDEVLRKDVICNPKALDPDMEEHLQQGQILFGWLHAVQGRKLVDILTARKMTGIAWGEMFENGIHVFWRNNEIAGEAAVIHASLFNGFLPEEWNVAVLGRGNCARGACRMLDRLGARVTIYPKERMFSLRGDIERYNVVVNTLLWDVFEERLVLSRDDIKRMPEGAMIIDVSCDAEGMCIETSHPTPISDPVFTVEGVVHYAVDHAPALYYRSASRAISSAVSKYLNCLINGDESETLERAVVIRDGEIVDQRITRFQGR